MKNKTCSILVSLFISIGYVNAQDFFISFEGTGASTTVATVKVENLTQGTSLTMDGSDVLHLMGSITGIEPIRSDARGDIMFYPNPMNDYTRMQFVLPEPGVTVIALYDISGRVIVQRQESLIKGEHTFYIQGVKEGVYFAKIRSDKYSFSERLISKGSNTGETKIEYINSDDKANTILSQELKVDIKGRNAEKVMQYNTGDRLKLTGISDIYSTVITDIPTEGKTMTFDFIPCTDGDNNNYSVLKIGSQTWMAKNLMTKTYSNGDPIKTTDPASADVYEQNTVQSECTYQWAYDSIESYVPVYGRLYTFYAVKDDRNICPTGWHVPTNSEWITLRDNIGGESIAGKELKETGIVHWPSPNSNATDKYGFSALPGGRRDRYGPFDLLDEAGYWWTSSKYYYDYIGIAYHISDTNDKLSDFTTNAIFGFSVRCLKDD